MSEKKFEFSTNLRDKVFRFAARLLDSYEDGQDIAQDVFEKLWVKRESFDKIENIEALSLKITRDLCLNKVKHQKTKREKLKNVAFNEKHRHHKTNYSEKELVEITKQLISKLPEKQKMIIHLRDVEGAEFTELSELLEIDINAVRMNLSRARKTIREELLKIINYGL